ncbi:MAG TPA: ABC transporter permease [Bryobacteraceae bacterium]|jgi:predicted permease|nr:ABC transporter permease [Bryobacteraceae bacterium]
MAWTRFFRRRRWDEERSRELEAYLQIETDENIARGMAADDARLAARRKLGNPTRIREEIYRMNTLGFLESLWQDLRYGARLLRLSPAFALVAIASLALGIGANTAIFQLLDAVRLRSLPVQNPQELAEVGFDHHGMYAGRGRGRFHPLSNALWEEIRDRQQAFSGVFAWGTDVFNLARGGEIHNAQGLWVSGEFFSTLGVQPMLGRVLTPSDDRPGCGSPGVVISAAFWQREFGGSPDVVGRTLTLNGHLAEIVGVSQPSFFGVEVGRTFDVAAPLCSEPAIKGEYSMLVRRDGWWLDAMGRLKPGWSLAQATAHLGSISPGLFEASVPAWYEGVDKQTYLAFKLKASRAGSGLSALRNEYDRPLRLLLGIAGLVLLIACANLANLMLARAATREREIAVRLALGASRGRLIRQLLAECVLLASLGAFFGAVLARSLSQFLVTFLSTQGDPLFVDLNADWRVLGFTAAVAILTCLLFGLAPALRATRNEPVNAMKAGGRGMTARRERFGLRRMLVVSQVALSLVLLVGALLFVRSLRNLVTLDAGFQQGGILAANVDLTALHLPAERRLLFKRDLVERVRRIPGVDAAAQTAFIVWGDYSDAGIFDNARQFKGITRLNWVDPGYIRTLQIALLSGRDFNMQDTLASQRVAIVNQAFARKVFGAGNPIGKSFQMGAEPGQKPRVHVIVGLVKNTKYADLREDFPPIAFLPAAQDDNPDVFALLYVRSNSPQAPLVSAIKRVMGEASPEINLEFHALRIQIRDSLLREQLMATLSGFFGLLAGLLATIGLYGVMSYMVARRRTEIGIRMALGAERNSVSRMILREAASLTGMGLVAGTILALALGRTASSMLFELRPNDPLTMAMAIAALATVALAASYLPAQRAAGLDPMTALREE